MVHGRTKQHPEELRAAAIRRFRSCQNVAQLAREIGIPRQTLYRWIDESERVEARHWKWIFSKAPCRQSRLDAARTAQVASWHLRLCPRRDVVARRSDC